MTSWIWRTRRDLKLRREVSISSYMVICTTHKHRVGTEHITAGSTVAGTGNLGFLWSRLCHVQRSLSQVDVFFGRCCRCEVIIILSSPTKSLLVWQNGWRTQVFLLDSSNPILVHRWKACSPRLRKCILIWLTPWSRMSKTLKGWGVQLWKVNNIWNIPFRLTLR